MLKSSGRISRWKGLILWREVIIFSVFTKCAASVLKGGGRLYLTERVIKLWLQEVFTIWLFSLRRQLKSTAHFKSRNLHPERMISYDDRTGFYAWILKKQEWVPWHNIQCLKFYHRSYRNLKNGVVSNGIRCALNAKITLIISAWWMLNID